MRSFSAGLLSVLAALQQPRFAVVVDFDALDVHYTNRAENVSYGGTTYTPATIEVAGISENFLAEVPSARTSIGDLDGTERVRFFEDSFRGELVTVTLLYDVSGTWTALGVAYEFLCDVDEAGPTGVSLRLAISDASRGSEVPRRTTQESGCQHDFMGPLCPFRPRTGLSSALNAGCAKTLAACKEHFPPITEGGTTSRVPLPYGGFIGGVAARLVR